MVSKQAHEVEKGTEGSQGDKRTSPARTGRTRKTQTATAGKAASKVRAADALVPTPAPSRSYENEY